MGVWGMFGVFCKGKGIRKKKPPPTTPAKPLGMLRTRKERIDGNSAAHQPQPVQKTTKRKEKEKKKKKQKKKKEK